MQRRTGDLKATRRGWLTYLAPYNTWIPLSVRERRYREERGRFRKKHAFDCGNTACTGCHPDKYPRRRRTDKEKLADLAFKEQLREMREPTPEPEPEEHWEDIWDNMWVGLTIDRAAVFRILMEEARRPPI